MPVKGNFDDPSGLLVPTLRDKFLEEYEKDPEAYDFLDVQDLKEEERDWYMKRFLLNAYMDMDGALKMLCQYMRWRKEIGLRYIKYDQFPREFYALGALFIYEKDKNGLSTIYIRVKYVQRIPELVDAFKRFVVFNMNKVDEAAAEQGWVLIFDFTGATIANCDFEFVHFMITLMDVYFPCGVDYILTYELPWVLSTVWKIIRACIPENSRKFVKSADKKTIDKYVAREHMPDFMGGTCKRGYRAVPVGCPTTEEYSRKVLGLPCKVISRILLNFKPHVDIDIKG